MFALPPAQFEPDALDQLAESMAVSTLPASRIPSGYVYLGQFIGHDLSKLEITPAESVLGERILQQRTPALDLENVYGEGFDDPRIAVDQATGRMLLGRFAGRGGELEHAGDLPRHPASTPVIPDERDDENLLIGQLHAAFLRLHNFFCERLSARSAWEARTLFAAARRQLILHYQEVVLYDFLRAVLDDEIFRSVVLRGECLLFRDGSDALSAVPLEFAVAAFRFGHSMVRRHYTLNVRQPLVGIDTLFAMTGRGAMQGAQGALPATHRVDWQLFFPVAGGAEARFMNFAMRIGPAINFRLPDGHNLAQKSLYTESRCRLPDAQNLVASIARCAPAVRITPLGREALNPEVQFIDGNTVRSARLLDRCAATRCMLDSTPLSYYLLAEAHAQHGGLRLGRLGSRIVAEVLFNLIAHSSPSCLRAVRESEFVRASGCTAGRPHLTMSDLLRVAV
jgi:hypothetical protein